MQKNETVVKKNELHYIINHRAKEIPANFAGIDAVVPSIYIQLIFF